LAEIGAERGNLSTAPLPVSFTRPWRAWQRALFFARSQQPILVSIVRIRFMPTDEKNLVDLPTPMPVASCAKRARLAQPDHLIRFDPQEMSREADVHFLR